MTAGDSEYRAGQRADLLRFAQGAAREGGFGYLDDAGNLDPDQPMLLYVTCRMVHVFCLGVLADEPAADGGPDTAKLARLAEHGVSALVQGPLQDGGFGGWFSSIAPDGEPEAIKQAYAQAFVVLAATSALVAGIPGAQTLLDMALAVQEKHFWDEDAGMVVDEWNREFTVLDDYRGANANMHTVEAYLAAGDVTGEHKWHRRAGRISQRVVSWARAVEWRIPEHADGTYTPQPELNKEQPADAFKPYGATVGHGMEWARLLIAVDASLGSDAPEGLLEAAIALNERAVTDGWAADGAEGFVYTTDWEGSPVVRARMHWVLAEAICTSTVLLEQTGDQRYAEDLQRWWDYADEYLIDHDLGSWHHELGGNNQPASATWSGKPDVYHAYQAALMADVPVAPSFASALWERKA